MRINHGQCLARLENTAATKYQDALFERFVFLLLSAVSAAAAAVMLLRSAVGM